MLRRPAELRRCCERFADFSSSPARRPSLVTGLHFQRSKLALIGSRGVEIMDLESMRCVRAQTLLPLPPLDLFALEADG